jgi:hypothetical protein
LSRTIVLRTKRTAKKIVQRSRLRSTSEPPREARVLARMEQDEEHQDDRDGDLDYAEKRFHGREA